MPIPIANRMGQLNAPNVNPGKAVSAAEPIADIGQTAAVTLKLMERASDDVGKAIIAQQRQDEQLSAQEAITEYLAGRQKLDTVRNALSLENAVKFEDKYYREAEKMHTEFLNKINGLKYADIRENVRNQANNTNIQEAAQAENFFWKQKEDVADKHTDAYVETVRRQVINSINVNGPIEYNAQIVAQGYKDSFDALSARLIQKGYRRGSVELDLAMSEKKDKFFRDTLEEVSHLPNNGLNIAHELGKVFKKEMTPEAWNNIMKPISQHNLSEELYKNPYRFFTNGDVINGDFNMPLAEKYSSALDDAERRAFLEGIQQRAKKGNTDVEKAVVDTDFERRFMTESGLRMSGMLGTDLGLVPGTEDKELKDITKEQRQKIAENLRKNYKYEDLMQNLRSWGNIIDHGVPYVKLINGQTKELGKLTDDEKSLVAEQYTAQLSDKSKDILNNRITFLRKMLVDNPEIVKKGLRHTFFEGKRPSAYEVGMAATGNIVDKMSRSNPWWKKINIFNILEAPYENINYSGALGVQRAVETVALSKDYKVGDEMRKGFYGIAYDDMTPAEQNQFWWQVAEKIEMETGKAYSNAFSAAELGEVANTIREDALYRDIYGSGTSRMNPGFGFEDGKISFAPMFRDKQGNLDPSVVGKFSNPVKNMQNMLIITYYGTHPKK